MEYYVATKKDEFGLYPSAQKELHVDLWKQIKTDLYTVTPFLWKACAQCCRQRGETGVTLAVMFFKIYFSPFFNVSLFLFFKWLCIPRFYV